MLLSPSPAWAACVWHAATLACCDCLYHPITLFAQSLCIHSILALLAVPLQQDPSGLEQNAPWKQSPEFFPKLQKDDGEGMSRRPPPAPAPWSSRRRADCVNGKWLFLRAIQTKPPHVSGKCFEVGTQASSSVSPCAGAFKAA